MIFVIMVSARHSDNGRNTEARKHAQHSRKFLDQFRVRVQQREDLLSLPRWNRKDHTLDTKLLVAMKTASSGAAPKIETGTSLG